MLRALLALALVATACHSSTKPALDLGDSVDGDGFPVDMAASMDLAANDLAGSDLGSGDFAPADLAPTYAHPTFVGGSYAEYTDVDTVTVARPAGTTEGVVLLALVAGVNTVTTTEPNIDLPSGWSVLSSGHQPGGPPGLAVWLWRYATASEPSTYTFTGSAPLIAYVAAYAGTVSVGVNGPFDNPDSEVGSTAVPATFPTINAVAHDELVVVQAWALDTNGMDGDWTQPSGYTTRNTNVIVSADVVAPNYGAPVGGGTSEFVADSRVVTFAVALRGIGGP